MFILQRSCWKHQKTNKQKNKNNNSDSKLWPQKTKERLVSACHMTWFLQKDIGPHLPDHVGCEHQNVEIFMEALWCSKVAYSLQTASANEQKVTRDDRRGRMEWRKLSPIFTNLEGEFGRAHHFNDVECRPADVIANHLQLEAKWRNTVNSQDIQLCESWQLRLGLFWLGT